MKGGCREGWGWRGGSLSDGKVDGIVGYLAKVVWEFGV